MVSKTFQVSQSWTTSHLDFVKELLQSKNPIKYLYKLEDFLMTQNKENLKSRYKKSLESGDSDLVI